MELKSETVNGVLLLTPDSDRIDAANAVHLKEKFRASISGWQQRIVIDLSGVGFMDSSGLGALVAMYKSMGPKALELLEPAPMVSKVLKLTKLDQVFVLHQDRQSALGDQTETAQEDNVA